MLTIWSHGHVAAPRVPWKAIALGFLVFAASFPLWH